MLLGSSGMLDNNSKEKEEEMSHKLAVFNFDFSILTTSPFKMLHFNTNHISTGHLVADI